MHDRLELLRIVAAEHPAPVCAEVGVYKGQYARQILEIAKPSRLFLIDPWGQVDRSEYTDYPALDAGAWEAIYARVQATLGARPEVSVVRSLSLPAAARFDPKTLDFVYVDADHSYEHVKADLDAWLPKVRSGGFIGGHDIDQKPVYQAVMETIGHLNPKITSKSGLKSYLARVP